MAIKIRAEALIAVGSGVIAAVIMAATRQSDASCALGYWPCRALPFLAFLAGAGTALLAILAFPWLMAKARGLIAQARARIEYVRKLQDRNRS